MALSFAMLSACGGEPVKRPDLGGPKPDPVIETKTIVRRECPAELFVDPGKPPVPAQGAIIHHNAAGGDYLDALSTMVGRLLAQLADARAQCPASAR